jgi:hypothetical protein
MARIDVPQPASRRDPSGDELVPDRLRVGLGEELVDLVLRRRGDPGEDLAGFVVAGLDTLQVQDRETAKAGQLSRKTGVDDRVHGGRQDRDREGDAAQLDRQVNVRRLDRARAGRQRDVLEAVGGTDRVDLRMEDPALRGGAGLGLVEHERLLER